MSDFPGPGSYDTIRVAVDSVPKDTVVVAILVDPHGNFAILANNFMVDRPTIYQALGVLEQAKLNLLASVPTNRPLREPEPDDEDEDDDGLVVGQA